MKTLKDRVTVLSLAIALIWGVSCTQKVLAQQPSEEELIVGTWVAEDNADVKLVFNANGQQKEYVNSELIATNKWSIKTTSPQCGREVPIGPNFSYLKLVNIDDTDEKYCYEILSLNDEALQMRLLGRGGFLLYYKQ